VVFIFHNNSLYTDKFSLLLIASANCYTLIVTSLLLTDVSVNIQDSYGMTALMRGIYFKICFLSINNLAISIIL
jgi:hypothetical protein